MVNHGSLCLLSASKVCLSSNSPSCREPPDSGLLSLVGKQAKHVRRGGLSRRRVRRPPLHPTAFRKRRANAPRPWWKKLAVSQDGKEAAPAHGAAQAGVGRLLYRKGWYFDKWNNMETAKLCHQFCFVPMVPLSALIKSTLHLGGVPRGPKGPLVVGGAGYPQSPGAFLPPFFWRQKKGAAVGRLPARQDT
jgi:hypothetical protein